MSDKSLRFVSRRQTVTWTCRLYYFPWEHCAHYGFFKNRIPLASWVVGWERHMQSRKLHCCIWKTSSLFSFFCVFFVSRGSRSDFYICSNFWESRVMSIVVLILRAKTKNLKVTKAKTQLLSNFDGLNSFWIMEICSRHGESEPREVTHSAGSSS